MYIRRKVFSNAFENNFNDYEAEERLYSTGDADLDDLLEKAFCEGYEYAQREFADSDDYATAGAAGLGAVATGAGAYYGGKKLRDLTLNSKTIKARADKYDEAAKAASIEAERKAGHKKLVKDWKDTVKELEKKKNSKVDGKKVKLTEQETKLLKDSKKAIKDSEKAIKGYDKAAKEAMKGIKIGDRAAGLVRKIANTKHGGKIAMGAAGIGALGAAGVANHFRED